MRLGAAIIGLMLLSQGAIAAEEIQPRISLRDTGYLLGDLIDERVDVDLPNGIEIEAGSLPPPGRVAPWMEVRSAKLEGKRSDGTQTINVTYQIFGEVEQAMRVPLPGFKFRVRGAAGARTVEVPPQSFLLSPALPSSLADEDRELRPSPSPSLLPLRHWLVGAAASLALVLACVVYLLWRYDRLPFLERTPGPLSRMWRRWRGKSRRDLSDDERDALLRDMHGAFNRSAGETLYPSTLALLFERAPHLAPLREEIEGLFGASWSRFYGPSRTIAPSSEKIFAMLHSAADRERGVPC